MTTRARKVLVLFLAILISGQAFPAPALAQLKKLADIAAENGGTAAGRDKDKAAYWYGALSAGDVLNKGETIIYSSPGKDSWNIWQYTVTAKRVWMYVDMNRDGSYDGTDDYSRSAKYYPDDPILAAPVQCEFMETVENGDSIKCYFKASIVPMDENNTDITLKTLNYTGEEIEPVVMCGGKELTKGTDYTMTVSPGGEIVDAGEYTVTVTGIGNYTGTATRTVKVEKCTVEQNLFGVFITSPNGITYSAQGLTEKNILTVEPEVAAYWKALKYWTYYKLETVRQPSGAKGLRASSQQWVKVDEVKDTGTYKAVLVIPEQKNFNAAEIESDDWIFTVVPAQLTLTDVSVDDKVYDATPTATISADADPQLSGVFEGDDVSLDDTDAQATFVDADGQADKTAGNDKTVRLTGYQLVGEQAQNYFLPDVQGTSVASIAPKPVKLVGISALDKTYDGTTAAELVFDAAEVLDSCDGDEVYVDQQSTTGTFVKPGVGTHRVDLSLAVAGADAGNYVVDKPASQTTTKGVISARPVTVTARDQAVKVDETFANDISQAEATGLVQGQSLSSVKLTFDPDVTTDAATGTIAPSAATIADANDQDVTDNYAITYKNGNLTVNKGETVSSMFEVTLPADETLTYDGKAKVVTASATSAYEDRGVGEVTVRYFDSKGHETSPVHAGTYTVRLDVAEGENFKAATGLANASWTFTVAPKPVTINGAAAQDKTYDGTTAATLKDVDAYEVGGRVGNDDVFVVPGTATFDNKNVGKDKTVTFQGFSLGGALAADYVLSAQPEAAKATITPLLVNVVGASGINKQYDTTVTAMLDWSQAKIRGLVEGDEVEVDDTVTGVFESAEPAENLQVDFMPVLKGKDAANYAVNERGSQTTTTASILKAQVTATVEPRQLTYDGTEQALVTASISPKGSTLSWFVGEDVPSSDDQWSSTLPLAKDAGVYTVWYKAGELENILGTDPVSVTVTISPKVVGLTWSDATITYDGTEQAPDVEVTGLVQGDACEVAVTGAATDVGRHTATVTGLNNANYALPEEGVEKVFVIEAKVVGLEWTNTVLSYIGTPQLPVVTATGLVQGDTCDVVLDGAATNVGEHTATAVDLSNKNYALPKEATRKFVIGQKVIGLEWTNTKLTYDGTKQAPAATVTGLVQGDTCTAIVVGAATDAGEHTATVAGLSNKNYSIPKNASCVFTIAPKIVGLAWTNTKLNYDGTQQAPTATAVGLVKDDECDVTVTGAASDAGTHIATASGLSNANYALPASASCEFTIVPKVVSIAWTNTRLDYDGTKKAPSATATGLVGGDVCDVTVTGAASDAGTHTATAAKLSNANYALPVDATAEYTVAPKVVGLEWANTELVYDGTKQAPSATATGLVDGDACDVTVTGAALAVGTHTAKAASISNPNYELPVEKVTQFKIAAKPVSIEWTNAELVYDGTKQAPKAAVSGLVEGDVCEATVAGATRNAGTHRASVVGLSNPNYVLAAPADKDFTISPKAVNIAWENTKLTYDGTRQGPTATATGLVEGDACEVTVIGAAKNAGTHTATASKLSNPNYEMSGTVTKAFTIAPKVVGLKWENTKLTYDGTRQGPTATATGLAAGDACGVTVTGAAKDAGTHTATAKLSNANYALPAKATASFTIAPKVVGLKWGNTKLTYNASAQVPTATATGILSGDECVVRVGGAARNVGTHTATATSLSNANYSLPTSRTMRYTIGKASLVVTAKNKTIAFGSAAANAGVTYQGLLGGDKASSLGGKLTYSYGAYKKGSYAGTYAITPAGLTSTNYNITYKKGTLTVSAPSSVGTTSKMLIEGRGWVGANAAGVFGTTGQALKVTAMSLKLNSLPYQGTIEYRAHFQQKGWQTAWAANGATSSNGSTRLEAVQIRLTGTMATKYDVWYRAHVEGFGWMGWAKNGAKSGSVGDSKRLEAIQIVVLKKGTTPTTAYKGIKQSTTKVFVSK